MMLNDLLPEVCAPSRASADAPSVSAKVYLYSNTAFGFPYSPATQISEGLAQRYTFQGREASANAGAPMYYRNRMYAAGLGRFSRRDPVLGGDPLFNAYGFPTVSPAMNLDPMGLAAPSLQQILVWREQLKKCKCPGDTDVGVLVCRHIRNVELIIAQKTKGAMKPEVLDQAKAVLDRASTAMKDAEKVLKDAAKAAGGMENLLNKMGAASEALIRQYNAYDNKEEGLRAISKELAQHLGGKIALDVEPNKADAILKYAAANKWGDTAAKLAVAAEEVGRVAEVVGKARNLVGVVGAFGSSDDKSDDQRLVDIMELGASITAKTPGVGKVFEFYAKASRAISVQFARWRIEFADFNVGQFAKIDAPGDPTCRDASGLPYKGENDGETLFTPQWNPGKLK